MFIVIITFLKVFPNKPIYKNRNYVTDVKNKLVVTKEGVNWELGVDIYTPLYMKEIMKTYRIAQGPLFSAV